MAKFLSCVQLESDEVVAVVYSRESVQGSPGAQIPIQTPAAENLDNLSICLRFRIQNWYFGVELVKTPSFSISLISFDQPFLVLKTNDQPQFFQYDWLKALSLSTSTWNSVCFCYNGSVGGMKMVLNGLLLSNSIETNASAMYLQ